MHSIYIEKIERRYREWDGEVVLCRKQGKDREQHLH